MTKEEAWKIINNCGEFIRLNEGGDLTLDGWFTVKELEALLYLVKSGEWKAELR